MHIIQQCAAAAAAAAVASSVRASCAVCGMLCFLDIYPGNVFIDEAYQVQQSVPVVHVFCIRCVLEVLMRAEIWVVILYEIYFVSWTVRVFIQVETAGSTAVVYWYNHYTPAKYEYSILYYLVLLL